jgi:hypothetical protein
MYICKPARTATLSWTWLAAPSTVALPAHIPTQTACGAVRNPSCPERRRTDYLALLGALMNQIATLTQASTQCIDSSKPPGATGRVHRSTSPPVQVPQSANGHPLTQYSLPCGGSTADALLRELPSCQTRGGAKLRPAGATVPPLVLLPLSRCVWAQSSGAPLGTEFWSACPPRDAHLGAAAARVLRIPRTHFECECAHIECCAHFARAAHILRTSYAHLRLCGPRAVRVSRTCCRLLDAKEARHVDEVLATDDVVHEPDRNGGAVSHLHRGRTMMECARCAVQCDA